MIGRLRLRWWSLRNFAQGYRFGPVQRCRRCDHTTPFHYPTCVHYQEHSPASIPQDGVAHTATRDASRQSGGGPTAAPEGHVKCPECGASIAWEGELPDDCLRCGAPFQEREP